MSAWPASLPQYMSAEGYSETVADNTIRSKVDAGPAKVRRRFTAGVDRVQGTVTMSQAQYAAFLAWYIGDQAGGSLSFSWTRMSTGAACTYRFVSPPQATPRGPMIAVRLDLEVLP